MLEIPEAQVIAQQINAKLKGERVQSVIVNASPHKFAWFNGDPEAYAPLFSGLCLDSANARGGQVEISFGSVRLVLCDGVNARYIPANQPSPKTHQLLIAFESGATLCFTVQMYGGLYAFRDGDFNNPYYLAACEKPSPLTDAFSAEYFERLRADSSPKLSAKAFLATEQRVPGLGNGVLQDILYCAGIHPKRKLGTLADTEYAKLYRCVIDTLRDMVRLGGRDVESDLYGNPGGYRTRCSRLTLGTPCAVCGASIVKESYMGGAVYVCPVCQPVRG